MDILPACVSRDEYFSSKEHPKHTSCKLKKCTCKLTPYVAIQKILPRVMIHFVYKWESKVYKLNPSLPKHLITNLAYKVKPHHKRNQYLRARLHSSTDVNIMPASVYMLVFCDPHLKKLASGRLEIGTYTTNTVKFLGSCTFYLVHPDTKCLQQVTFYFANTNGSFYYLVPPCLHLA